MVWYALSASLIDGTRKRIARQASKQARGIEKERVKDQASSGGEKCGGPWKKKSMQISRGAELPRNHVEQ